jgi:CDP-glycerol glycerophosphotransferase (TagB/SpsB family)
MTTTINERISLLVKTLGYESLSSFDKALGIARNSTHNITGTKQCNPSYLFLELIKKKFVNVDANWLLTGEGEMFTPDKARREYVEQLETQLTEATEQAKIYKFSVMQAMARQQQASFSSVSKFLPVGRVLKVDFAHSLANKATHAVAM